MLKEDDADDIFQQLRLWIELELLLADERPHAINITSAVASAGHDITEPPRMKFFGIPSPAQIACAPFRIALARQPPTAHCPAGGGNGEGLGSIRSHPPQRCRYFATVNQ